MPDSRLESYARLLVERCVNVQAGWQVVVNSTPLAQPLLIEVARKSPAGARTSSPMSACRE